MIITKHIWPDGVRSWTLSDTAGSVLGFFWSAQEAANYACGKTVSWKEERHEH